MHLAVLFLQFICYKNAIYVQLQVNLFQKISFLNQLTHNMTRDCSLNSPKNTSLQHVVYKYCFECKKQNKKFCTHVVNLYFLGNSMNNLQSYCGLTDARMRASEKDLPVESPGQKIYYQIFIISFKSINW